LKHPIFLNCDFAIDKDYQVDVIFTDLSKAFDKVAYPDHKLECSRIYGTLLCWIGTYFSGRTQRVQTNGDDSGDLGPAEKLNKT
jgi:hypothetical protein